MPSTCPHTGATTHDATYPSSEHPRTDTAYALQQQLYTLYRKYYHTGCVVLLTQKDFDHGTCRLTRGGLYVLCEDIVFNPDESYLTTNTEYSSNNAYSMGYFAALTIECDDVVVDLQEHTIRQSYEHYAKQRFFNIVELANMPFIKGQGPASIKNTSVAFKPANNVLLINGTLGLSSHGGVHGNNNSNIMLQKLRVQDFETTGVQLNGVKTAYLDGVTTRGVDCAPLSSLSFTLFRHVKELQALETAGTGNASIGVKLADDTVCATLVRSEMLTALIDIQTALLAPFVTADTNHTSAATPDSVTAALKSIYAALLLLTDLDVPTDNTAGGFKSKKLTRFVNPVIDSTDTALNFAAPDGSAMYGFVVDATGVAVGELSAVCPANGNACCSQASHDSSCCRKSECVTFNNCLADEMHLNAPEWLAVHNGTKILRDVTGAVIDVRFVEQGDVLEFARIYINSELTSQTTFDVCVQRLLVCTTATYEVSHFVAECTGHKFITNGDVMAHVSKGVFGFRIEDVKGLKMQHCTARNLTNHSKVECLPAKLGLPTEATVESLIKNALDTTSDLAYGGVDLRGLFLGFCECVDISHTNLSKLVTNEGVCRAVELDNCKNGRVHKTDATGLDGISVQTVLVHHTCTGLNVRELCNDDVRGTTTAVRTLLKAVQAAVDDALANPTDTAKQALKDERLCALLRLPFADPALLVFEQPSSIGDIQLC